MMFIVLYCYRKGLIFVFVYDCYWIYVVDVVVMNQVCWEQFVCLYSEFILEDLFQFLVSWFCFNFRFWKFFQCLEVSQLKVILQVVFKLGVFDLEWVKYFIYFFS